MIVMSKKEIQDLCELDALCFPEPLNYPYGVMKGFVGEEGAMVLRQWHGDRVVAFCLSNSRRGEIITIDVHPKFRGKGMGRRLLQETIHIMKERGCSRIFSHVGVDNLASQQLHVRNGFAIKRIIPNYYADGSSAYLLVRDLSAESESSSEKG
jgi:ribosomal-protein-alanine N-acetyltransferase